MLLSLDGKRLLLGVTGGIAAYKAADLVRRLKEAGAEVQVVMTAAARQFVTPMTFQALSGRPVRDELWDVQAEAGMGHIELARWADLILIAPASADLLARLAHGLANDLLTTLCLASDKPIAVAPAMNRLMWANAATQANLATLRQRGLQVWGPASGGQACGEVGEGRMLEPMALVEGVRRHLAAGAEGGKMAGLRLLITAGPTREPLDPVRFITNRSSGKMGFAVAAAAAAAGAEVTLVSGPVALPTPAGVVRLDVETAEQMLAAVMAHVGECHCFIATAAVADYRAATLAAHKIKKSADQLTLELVRNPDILATVASQPSPPFTVGFAAETQALEHYAEEKRRRKKLDMMAANRVGAQEGFDSDQNALLVLWEGGQRALGPDDKRRLGSQLIDLIAERYHQTRTLAASAHSAGNP